MRDRVAGFVQRHWLFLLLMIAAPLVEYRAGHEGAPGPAIALLRNPFAAIAAASVFCRYVIDDLRGPVRRWIVYLTPLTWLGALVVEGGGAPPALLWLDMLFALGVLGALGFVVAACMAGERRARSNYLGQLMDALLLPLGASMVPYGLWATFRLNPVYDTRVYGFEELLGVKVSLWSAQSYVTLTRLPAVATACYNLVAVAIAVVAAAQRERRRGQQVLNGILIAGAFGFALYVVCPVVGPLVSFGPFYPRTLPIVPLDAPLLIAASGAPRNGMPSLHTIWALLIWFNAAGVAAPLRRGLRVFVALTLWAVLSPVGSHWLMDVVVSVPVAVAIQSAFLSPAGESARRRWSTVGVCAGMTAIWLLGLRAGTLVGLPWAMAWAAVLVTLWWPLRRWRATAFVRMAPVVRGSTGSPTHEWTLSGSRL